MNDTPTYGSLQEWLDRTNTSRSVLCEISGISPQALSGFLKCKQRISVMRAMRLSRITGIAVENLVDWRKFPRRVRDAHAA